MATAALLALSRDFPALSAPARDQIRICAADTYAVMAAGWDSPAALALRKASPSVPPPWAPFAAPAPDPAGLALVWGTVAHALDYDDVHMTSVTHPGAVLIPAILAQTLARPELAPRQAEAFALGLAFNVALGEALGFDHYAQGWHATSTTGTLAAAASVAHLLGLEDRAFRAALAIAAAQSSGLQANFGTMVKPLQAGLAASAGIRAGLLAEAGVEGPEDVLAGDTGVLRVFSRHPAPLPRPDVDTALASLSRKLFPCCYLAHRPIAAALILRGALTPGGLARPDLAITVEVPPGCLKALSVGIPTTGLEAKFSGQYATAFALLHGSPGLAAFTDERVGDGAVLDLARRVRLTETGATAPGEVGIDRGEVVIQARLNGVQIAEARVTAYPGSPAAPITAQELLAKVTDCTRGTEVSAADLMARAADFAGLPRGPAAAA